MTTLITDLDTIRRRTEQAEDENINFRIFLKFKCSWSDKRLDAFVHELVREVTAQIDCTQCAHCCRALEISLCTEDLVRLAVHLEREVSDIECEYAAPGKLCDRAFAQSPCAFLDGNRCSVYPARPRDCREYPHLDKPAIRQRMLFILDQAAECPIIFNVLEGMKATLWRRRR